MWTVYRQPECPSSDWVIDALRNHCKAAGGSVTVHDITTNDEARYFILDHWKFQGTPQVFYEQKHIGGLADTVKWLQGENDGRDARARDRVDAPRRRIRANVKLRDDAGVPNPDDGKGARRKGRGAR